MHNQQHPELLLREHVEECSYLYLEHLACRGVFLLIFRTSSRLLPFSKQMYCDALRYCLQAWISNLEVEI